MDDDDGVFRRDFYFMFVYTLRTSFTFFLLKIKVLLCVCVCVLLYIMYVQWCVQNECTVKKTKTHPTNKNT